MTLLVQWLVLAVSIAIAGAIVPGISSDAGFGTYLLAALVLAAVNLLIGPILRLLSAPIILITLGLFHLVINAFLLLLTAWIVSSFDVDGFWSALVGSAVISLLTILINLVVQPSRRHRVAT